MKYSLVELIEIITKLVGDIEVQFIREYEKAGLTARQLEYIEIIGKLDHPTLGEIAKAFQLSKPSVTAIVEKLVTKGYIRKVQSDEDRRSSHVHLSSKGHALVKMHDKTHHRIAELFQDNLERSDLDRLVAILNKAVSKI
jgi:DNA-binding MarR family transcriptional regulator